MKIFSYNWFKFKSKTSANTINCSTAPKEYCLYVVLSRPRSIVAKIIQFYTRDTYTHAAISFCSCLSEMYSFSRKWSYYPFLGRLSCERFDSGFLKRCQYLPGLVIKISLTRDEYEKAKRLVNIMFSQKKLYKYDMRGFFGNIFNISINSKNRFTCSKFVAYILHESGIANFNQSLSLIRPQTLANIKGDVIYKGDLKKYAKVTSRSEIAS
ncbi:MAG: hypothetical protein GX303_01300 [Clostridiales bacterium]|nr:hypothetical protein [Clostridiales bacterium]